MKSSALTPRPIVTGESRRLTSEPFERRAAPSTTAPSPMKTLRTSPVSTTVTPQPIVPRADRAAAAFSRAKRLSAATRRGRCRYIASRYASCAVSAVWIVTSRPPVSLRTETSTPLPKLVSPST